MHVQAAVTISAFVAHWQLWQPLTAPVCCAVLCCAMPHRIRYQLSCNDTASAMALFDDVAYGDLEQGSIYERSEANLLKVGHAPPCCSQSGCSQCLSIRQQDSR
jgi:hypothetical protein